MVLLNDILPLASGNVITGCAGKAIPANHKRLYRIYTMPSGSISGENPSGDYLRE
jgi:hypothetical protein